MDLVGRTAVITGAGSGIGRSLAIECANSGMNIVLVDIDIAGIYETRKLSRQNSAMCIEVNVSNASAMDSLANRVFAEFDDVGVLFNNAGVASGGWIWESTPEDWSWVLGVNLMGVVNGIRSFVPKMLLKDRPAHIVNTSSAAGILSIPTAATYCASKHAVLALSECLSHELQIKNARIGVSVLCPSYVRTGIVDSERHRPNNLRGADDITEIKRNSTIERGMKNATLTADDVAKITLKAVLNDRFYIFPHEKVLEEFRCRMNGILQGNQPFRNSLPQ